jgi:acetyl esterase/lipase
MTLGAEGMKGMPRTWIFNTDLEIMRDCGAVMEAEMRDSGVEVRREMMVGLPHYFWVFPVKKTGEEFRRRMVEGVRWVLEVGQ